MAIQTVYFKRLRRIVGGTGLLEQDDHIRTGLVFSLLRS